MKKMQCRDEEGSDSASGEPEEVQLVSKDPSTSERASRTEPEVALEEREEREG